MSLRQIRSEIRQYGVRVAWSNVRFILGYKIGGFTHATRRGA